MRDLYPGYFSPTDAEFDEIWRTAIILPDANILLHTLRYDAQTRKEVLATLSALKEQVWIPYQVGLEFLRNWRAVDADNRAVHATVQELVGKAGSTLHSAFDQASRHQTIDAKSEKAKIKTFIEGLRDSLQDAQKQHPDKSSAQEIVDEISALIGNSVGVKPTPELMDAWETEGKARYEAEKPPGYMDRGKQGRDKYGDFFVWKESLLRGAELKRPLIMITDDKKEDIAWIVRGERVGPRPELVEEYRAVTGEAFYSYTLDSFLQHAKRHVKAPISESTIEVVQKDRIATANFEYMRRVRQRKMLAARQKDAAALGHLIEENNHPEMDSRRKLVLKARELLNQRTHEELPKTFRWDFNSHPISIPDSYALTEPEILALYDMVKNSLDSSTVLDDDDEDETVHNHDGADNDPD